MKPLPILATALAALMVFGSVATAQETLYVRDGVTLNGRSGPGTGYKRLHQLPGGSSVILLGRSGTWGRVRLDTGTVLWVFLDYLTDTQPHHAPKPKSQPQQPAPKPQAQAPKPTKSANAPAPQAQQHQPKPKPGQPGAQQPPQQNPDDQPMPPKKPKQSG